MATWQHGNMATWQKKPVFNQSEHQIVLLQVVQAILGVKALKHTGGRGQVPVGSIGSSARRCRYWHSEHTNID